MSDIWSTIYTGLHVKSQLFLSDFNQTWILSTFFEKQSNIMETRPVGVEMLHADGQTHITTLKSFFSNLWTRLQLVVTRAWCWVIYFVDQQTISNVQIRNKSFVTRVNKKQGVEIDRPASGGGQEKSMKWGSFYCPLLEHTNAYGPK